MNSEASSIPPPEPPYSLGDRHPEPPELGHLPVQAVGVELGVAVRQLGALLARPALAAAEVLDRGDEVALLVGEGEVHGAEP